MDAASPHRRFQFSLRTLFVIVTLFCVVVGGYVAREKAIIAERAAELKRLSQLEPPMMTTLVPPDIWTAQQDKIGRWSISTEDDKLPWMRRLLGDHWVDNIIRPSSTPLDEIERLQSLFPEAEITAWIDPTGL